MGRARLKTLAVAAISLAIGAGVALGGSGGDSSDPWEVGETDESAALEANLGDPSDEGWNDDESNADEWSDERREDEDRTDEDSEPVEGESEESFSDRCHGVVSCTFTLVGEVIALPFRILDGAFRLIF